MFATKWSMVMFCFVLFFAFKSSKDLKVILLQSFTKSFV